MSFLWTHQDIEVSRWNWDTRSGRGYDCEVIFMGGGRWRMGCPQRIYQSRRRFKSGEMNRLLMGGDAYEELDEEAIVRALTS